MKIVAVGAIYYEINTQLATKQFHPNIEYLISGFEANIGGSVAYFAKSATHLGLAITIISKVGSDVRAKMLEDLCRNLDISTKFIYDSSVATNTAINIANEEGDLIMGVDKSASLALSGTEIEEKLTNLSNFDLLYISSILKTPHLITFWSKYLSQAKPKGFKVILDYGRSPESLSPELVSQLKGFIKNYVDVLLPSREDRLGEIMGTNDEVEMLKRTNVEFPNTITILKQDRDGASVCLDQKFHRAKTTPGNYNLTVGAGDVFNAAFVYAYFQDTRTLIDSLDFANQTALTFLHNLQGVTL